MTAPRRWRPRPLYVVAAVFAILLILVWQFFLSPAPAPVGPPPAPKSAPGR